MRTCILQLLTLVFCISLYAQKDTDVLLRINEEAFQVGEFKKVYLKNLELLQEDEKRDPEDYIDLFIPYKLKVQEAYRLGLDQKETYQKELEGYKKQLAKTFLTDVTLTDKLVEEAYDRMVHEIKARHILIRVPSNASPSDTLAAYNRAIEARDKILNGADFDKTAKAYSDDPSAKQNGGDLGWFKAFKMVYPFESAAYNTAVNEVSMPFKTSFGYHIVQPTGKRKGEGAIQVAHIMILHKQKDSTILPKKRIQSIYELLQSGEDFESLAKTYSDDTQTSSKGGLIRKFERGQMSSKEFENVAFGLQEIGGYSRPFETSFGWHIAKLVERYPLQSFEKEKGAIEARIKKDKRAQVISQALTTKLRKEYNMEDVSPVVTIMSDPSIGDFQDDKWVFKENATNSSKKAFSIRDRIYDVAGIAKFFERTYNPNRFSNKDQFIEETTRQYVDLKTQAYHEEHLEELDPDFANVLREYKEGLLIFDLMDQQIWSKAKTDSIGLQGYYTANKNKYREPKKAIATVYTAQDKVALEQFRKELVSNAKKAQAAQPSSIFKTDKEIVVSEIASYASGYKPAMGVSQVLAFNRGYVLYEVSMIQEERVKNLEEAKGAVMSDYQQDLEIKWISKLKSVATIDINKKVLKKLTKSLK